MKRLKNYVKENKIFSIIFPVMAVYYGFLMFYVKPWYDELYTYYSFISRGPLYAAIHWPVPNNHILYSVLSAFLDFFGNPYIGLRGISFLACLLNMVLLYEFAKKIVSKNLAAVSVLLYVSAYQINNLSVQGRGYTLTITFYLMALHCLYEICMTGGGKVHYIFFAVALTGGLYTIVSSTYWVLPVCLAGGLYLLHEKKYRTLLNLILSAVAAAVATLFLYSVVWLAIGSNLLCKDPESIYYGIYQLRIIGKAPLTALKTGMEYMLATPYIQGDTRSYIVAELFHYLTGVFQLHYLGMGEFLTVFLFAGAVLTVIYFIRTGRKKETDSFFCIYLTVSAVMLPVMLIIQSVQPYYRVFSFFSVPLTLLIVCMLQFFISKLKKETGRRRGSGIVLAAAALFCGLVLMRPDYHAQYAQRETEIAGITEDVYQDISSICYMDDFQKYVFKFYYDIEPEEAAVGTARYLLMPKEVEDGEGQIPQWPTLYSYDSVDWQQIDKTYSVIKESDHYRLYLHQ